MLRLPLADHRLQPRAPARQRLMRLGIARQHREVLILAEPVAQLLRLAHPAPPEPRPQRLDDLHLIAVHHHALAQFVQVVRAGRPPVVRNEVARPPIVLAQAFGHVGERQARRAASVRSALRRGPAPPKSACASRGQARGLRRGAQILELGADRLPGLRRQPVRRRVVLGVGNGIERGLGVAGAGQQPGEVAGLGPPARARRRPDAARSAAGRPARTSSRRGNRAPRRPRRASGPPRRSGPRPECGGRCPAALVRPPVAAATPACHSCDSYMTAICDSLTKWNLSALSIPGRACYISLAVCRTPAARIGAGWSSPVARQAHNLKVVGSNPTPATK